MFSKTLSSIFKFIMEENNVFCEFYFGTKSDTRIILFEKALLCSRYGKVIYILQEELNELPQLSEDFTSVDRNYIKMISFLYMPNLLSLIDGISTLPNWQNVPSTIILDDISEYCNKSSFQNATGIVAFLLDTARSCAKSLNSTCKLYISGRKETLGEENCKTLLELYSRNEQNIKIL